MSERATTRPSPASVPGIRRARSPSTIRPRCCPQSQRAAAAARRRGRRVRRDRRGRRRRPAARAPPRGRRPRRRRRRRSAYAPRFQFLTGALVAVGIAALVGSPSPIVGIAAQAATGRAWSSWKPTHRRPAGRHGDRRATSPAPTATTGRQLVKVDANDISYKGLPLLVALRKSADQGGEIQVHDEKGVLYQLCGLGVNCADRRRQALAERDLLLRREGLELALYSFRYLDGVKQVVVLIPPRPGKAQTRRCTSAATSCVPSSSRPLTSSLLPTAPTIARRHALARRAAGRPARPTRTSSRSAARASTTAASSCSTPTARPADGRCRSASRSSRSRPRPPRRRPPRLDASASGG